MKKTLLLLTILAMISCGEKPERKGFSVNKSSPEESEVNKTGLNKDSVAFDTRPNGILLTSEQHIRLIPVYKLNIREKGRKEIQHYTGSNAFHSSYGSYSRREGNNWNHNFMPGFEAMYGFNLVNVHLHDVYTKKTRAFFDEPVLVKTLYYPTFSKDTLNGNPVKRNYYMVSAYDRDSNGDGYINGDDLRKFFLFDIDGSLNSTLVPENYSVRSSQYDPANDYMYVYAVLDENENGHHDETEDVHVFWIDLKAPSNRGKLYE
jgi:hypothetical protein